MQRRAEAAAAYREMCDEMSNAWRKPIGDARRRRRDDDDDEIVAETEGERNANADEYTVAPWSESPAARTERERQAKSLRYYGGPTAPSTQFNRDPTNERTFGSRPWGGAKPGDVCMIDGRRGRLNERLECVPDERLDSMDARDAALQKCHVPTVSLADSNRIRAQAYADMCRELRDAWRK